VSGALREARDYAVSPLAAQTAWRTTPEALIALEIRSYSVHDPFHAASAVDRLSLRRDRVLDLRPDLVRVRRPGPVGHPHIPGIIPVGREGQVFGLYATTGRVAIWMSPALYAAAIALSPATTTAGRTAYGILGILVVILIGPAVLLPVKPGQGLHRLSLEDVAV
jgi:hypothetical protein